MLTGEARKRALELLRERQRVKPTSWKWFKYNERYKAVWVRELTFSTRYDPETKLFQARIFLADGTPYAEAIHDDLGLAVAIALDAFGQRAMQESDPSYGADGRGRNLMSLLKPCPWAKNKTTVPLPRDYQVAIRENHVLSGYEQTVSIEGFSLMTGIPVSVINRMIYRGNIEVLVIPRVGVRIPMEIVDGFRTYWLKEGRSVAPRVSEEFLEALYWHSVSNTAEHKGASGG